MTNNIALEAENISKQYRLGEVGTGTLSHDLNRFWARIRGKEDPFLKIGETNNRAQKGNSDYVWALKDINFKIEQGDAVGIIGRNGAGKSTLLKLLSKVTAPTTGDIKIKGRIASLLEVGTGFHPEMTGRENIFLNGAILGMTKKEIKRKFDEIVDFSGVERYIDTPVKRYSSGMYVRLAFAVAAHLDSEILIVDEVLAVGDSEFQKKCLGKMGDVSRGEGRTVLFVSHNMSAVKNLCKTGIVLKDGLLANQGSADDMIDFYMTNVAEYKPEKIAVINQSHRIYGSQVGRKIQYERVELLNPRDDNQLAISESIKIKIILKGNKAASNFRLSFSILNNQDECVGTFFSENRFAIHEGEHKELLLEIKNHQLSKGKYYLSMSVGSGNEFEGITDYDIITKVLFFEVSFKDETYQEMVMLWTSSWGNINFSNVAIKELGGI